MDQEFNASKFVEQFDTGEFNGRLHEELIKLSQEQLAEVALLLATLGKGGYNPCPNPANRSPRLRGDFRKVAKR
jgi:hypothetical protein